MTRGVLLPPLANVNITLGLLSAKHILLHLTLNSEKASLFAIKAYIMETVLDYGITEREWNAIIPYSKDDYMELVQVSEDVANASLAKMFFLRRDVPMYETYLNKLLESERNDIKRLLYHPR